LGPAADRVVARQQLRQDRDNFPNTYPNYYQQERERVAHRSSLSEQHQAMREREDTERMSDATGISGAVDDSVIPETGNTL